MSSNNPPVRGYVVSVLYWDGPYRVTKIHMVPAYDAADAMTQALVQYQEHQDPAVTIVEPKEQHATA